MEKKEIVQLLDDMSMEEKIGQLLQLTGSYFMDDAVLTGPEAEIGVTDQEIALCGSVLSIHGASDLMKIQDKIMKSQPHHIPALFMLDVIHGFRTVFPVPIAQGCTFNPELVKEGASISAKETAVSGVHITFSPMSDLCRDARWGRVMEGTGEDKYLNGIYTKAMVEGYQGDDIKKPYKVGACVKHFAAYGLPEAGREYNAVEVSNRTLFEDYLPAYEEGVKAGAVSVMTSFNTLDRIPSTANCKLMRDVLRNKMGFDGVLISDYGAVMELVNHGIAEDAKEAAKLAIKAGVDIEMMSRSYVSELKGLIEQGEVDQKLLDEAVMRVLILKNKLGLFEKPYKDASVEGEKEVILCKEHREAARKCAEESLVLLENDGILPLHTQGQHIAFIGPYADNKELFGAWALMADGNDANALSEIVPALYPNNGYTFEHACNIVPKDSLLSGLASTLETKYNDQEEALAMDRAVEKAAAADVVVLMLGEHRLQTGEAAAVGDIILPKKQLELLDKIARVNQNIVTVLFNGRPLDLREIKEKSKAVLEAWFPGTEGAYAVMDALFGKVNPSGRLSMSFPYSVGQVPVHYDEFATGRPKGEEGEQNKFCSRYEDIPNAPLYPFGYGLSYSEFSYSDRCLSKQKLNGSKNEDTIEARVTVTNQSEVPGMEVVQLYIQDVKGSVVRPKRELKGFKKIFLKPQESKTIIFTITEKMLRFYDIDMEFKSEPGEFRIYIGHDSLETHAMAFHLVKE
ncbi:MAG: beta-glucosidase BglX [bacterium]|nr:beta-glucosidase BglX [bacterium]